MKKLDTHLLVWLWPITIPLGMILLAILFAFYAWLWVGNCLIDLTINNKNLQ